MDSKKQKNERGERASAKRRADLFRPEPSSKRVGRVTINTKKHVSTDTMQKMECNSAFQAKKAQAPIIPKKFLSPLTIEQKNERGERASARRRADLFRPEPSSKRGERTRGAKRRSELLSPLTIGILAFHGAVEEHARTLAQLNAQPVEVRVAKDTENLDGLILPGGESTAFTLAIENNGLGEALHTAMGNDLPVFGTCAGAILLARGGALEQLPIRAKRNAYGPQLASGSQPVQLLGEAATLKNIANKPAKDQRGLPPLWLQKSAPAEAPNPSLFPEFLSAPRGSSSVAPTQHQ